MTDTSFLTDFFIRLVNIGVYLFTVIIYDLIKVFVLFFKEDIINSSCQHRYTLASLIINTSVTIKVGVLFFFIRRLDQCLTRRGLTNLASLVSRKTIGGCNLIQILRLFYLIFLNKLKTLWILSINFFNRLMEVSNQLQPQH